MRAVPCPPARLFFFFFASPFPAPSPPHNGLPPVLSSPSLAGSSPAVVGYFLPLFPLSFSGC